jgi:UDP-glucose 4-epimerase
MTLDNSKILVTGGFGALGHNLIHYLSANYNCSIHVIDNFSAGHANFINNITFSYINVINHKLFSVISFFFKRKISFKLYFVKKRFYSF